ncbi:MAG: Methyltransferase type 12 [Bacteroidetes bacterium]|nr:MAG: Methyltransferase type 12 [Bacteroidota bacterium]
MSGAKNISQKVNHFRLKLDEDELLPENKTCFFCGHTERNPVFVLQDKPLIRLLECTRCRAASASRMPREETLARYYRDYYPKDETKKNIRVTFKQVGRFSNHLYKLIAPGFSQVENLQILDYGGGDGSVAASLAGKMIAGGLAKNATITVVDYVEELTAATGSISLKRVDPGTPFPENTFHIIIASAIIEHIPEGGDVVRSLFSILKPGGFFYARTPWALPMAGFSRLLGKKWNFFFPAHVHDLGKTCWEYSAKNAAAGMTIIRSKPSIVESSFKTRFLVTTAAYLFKAPWYLFPGTYKLVGGWEIVLRKNT